MKYRELLEETKKYPNPFSLNERYPKSYEIEAASQGKPAKEIMPEKAPKK